ncbi:transposase [Lachnospiraceae bacterium PF1-22]
MRKVELTMNEEQKYRIIKKLAESGDDGNKDRAALKIGCSKRHIYRMLEGYKAHGKEYFSHGNKKRQPAHTFSNEKKQLILDLYRTKYSDANLTHYSELLEEHENIIASPSFIRGLLRQNKILSPKAKRSTKRALNKELRARKMECTSKKEAAALQTSILELEEAHPRRPRCAYAGEMLQMDASLHNWFAGIKTQLHVAIDDATGMIVGARFEEQETLQGYYHVFYQVLKEYGIPHMFFTDNRTVFEYTHRKDKNIEKDTFTQFKYACKQLGVEIKTSSIPQAKGRVERVFDTLQSRLTVELRLANVTSIQQANEFLMSYIKKFNTQFALPFDSIKSVFEKQLSDEKINLTLAVIANRVVDNGSCLKFQNQYYLPINKQGHPTHYRRGTKALVIRAFDGMMYASIQDNIYALDLLPDHAPSSKAFDLTEAPKEPKKRNIPDKHHPWRTSLFNKFANQQKHRIEEALKTN